MAYRSALPQADLTGFTSRCSPSVIPGPPSTCLNSGLIKTSNETNEHQVSGVEDYVTEWWGFHHLYSFFYRKRDRGSSPTGANPHEFVLVCCFMFSEGSFTLVISMLSTRGWKPSTRLEFGLSGNSRKDVA